MSDHETTLRNAVAELDEWLSTNKRTPNDSQVGMRAACLAGADALRRGTCGTCKWVRHMPDPGFPHEEDATMAVCAHESEAHPLHWCREVGNPETFGCTYYAPTEPTR